MQFSTLVNGSFEVVTSTISTFVEDVIEDCRDLDTDQMYAVMYGALTKVIHTSEQQESTIQGLVTTVTQQQSIIDSLISKCL